MNGEINVNIHGKEEVLKFSMWQIERMNALNNEHKDSVTFPKTALIYSALENSYRHRKIACPYSMEEIELWADDLTTSEEGEKVLVEINTALIESHSFKSLIKQANDIEDAKKKN